MVVNHQGEQAQHLHTLLSQKLSENIILYKQVPKQDDVWQALAGKKDDFLIYDRCGRLTHHIFLPFSILGTPYVENAIKETYCQRICGDCTYEVHTHTHSVCMCLYVGISSMTNHPTPILLSHTQNTEIPAECNRMLEVKPEGEEKPVTGGDTPHGGRGHHHHGNGHGHHGKSHGHGHGHHGESEVGREHGRGHGVEQQQHQNGAEGLHHGQAHGQVHVGQEHMGQQPKEVQEGHIMQRP
uniref:Selenoprotein P N-terminal domain-containing protein n=1 Tax=Oncorhynchus mykiss TaxID=8022 RepID=A0A8K9V8G4_ONCMY